MLKIFVRFSKHFFSSRRRVKIKNFKRQHPNCVTSPWRCQETFGKQNHFKLAVPTTSYQIVSQNCEFRLATSKFWISKKWKRPALRYDRTCLGLYRRQQTSLQTALQNCYFREKPDIDFVWPIAQCFYTTYEIKNKLQYTESTLC